MCAKRVDGCQGGVAAPRVTSASGVKAPYVRLRSTFTRTRVLPETLPSAKSLPLHGLSVFVTPIQAAGSSEENENCGSVRLGLAQTWCIAPASRSRVRIILVSVEMTQPLSLTPSTVNCEGERTSLIEPVIGEWKVISRPERSLAQGLRYWARRHPT
ncbi:hypothetical protein MTO96_022926 [Rhipicephalus appendiculatus]